MRLTEDDVYDVFRMLDITPDKYPNYQDPVSFGWQFQKQSTVMSTYSAGTCATSDDNGVGGVY